jgi:hypothetical protein
MNDMHLLSTPHFAAQESTELQHKVAPKAAPALVPGRCGLMTDPHQVMPHFSKHCSDAALPETAWNDPEFRASTSQPFGGILAFALLL